MKNYLQEIINKTEYFLDLPSEIRLTEEERAFYPQRGIYTRLQLADRSFVWLDSNHNLVEWSDQIKLNKILDL